MQIEAFFDKSSSTLTYLVWDEQTLDAVVIDPVLDYDAVNHQTSTDSVKLIAEVIVERGLRVHWLLETHVHADHLSGAAALQELVGGTTAISQRIVEVQSTFCSALNLQQKMVCDGSQFDQLLDDGQCIEGGSLTVKSIATPGHTPACTCFLIEDALFTGDAMFMPDFGTGRCDFPGGSAEQLYASITQRIYALPDATRIFVGHDYQPGGRELRYETTVGEEKASNKQLTATTSEADFVGFRSTRDAQLNLPRLIYQALQVNMRAGRLPKAEENGERYLKLPIAERE